MFRASGVEGLGFRFGVLGFRASTLGGPGVRLEMGVAKDSPRQTIDVCYWANGQMHANLHLTPTPPKDGREYWPKTCKP